MNSTAVDTAELFDKILIPLALAVAAWLLKDVLFGTAATRRSEARLYWEFQLRQVFEPLFFWSGVICFTPSPNHPSLGVHELAELLSRSASLLPIRHYYVFVKLLERRTGQSTSGPSMADVKAARAYVYGRIEVLNFSLCKVPLHFDPVGTLHVLTPLRYLWRWAVVGLANLGVWAALTTGLLAIFRNTSNPKNQLVVLGIVLAGIVMLVALDLKRRAAIARVLKSKQSH